MEILSDPTPDMLAMPRFDDGAIDMQELIRRLAEQVVNAVMDAEADQLCGGGANGRNGYRERGLATCVGTLALRTPKLRTGSFFPDDVIERYQRVDRALVAAVAEMYATGTCQLACGIRFCRISDFRQFTCSKLALEASVYLYQSGNQLGILLVMVIPSLVMACCLTVDIGRRTINSHLSLTKSRLSNIDHSRLPLHNCLIDIQSIIC